jgi:hypothetical protein
VLDRSLEQHAAMCMNNSDTLQEAKALGKLLEDDIDCRIKRYSKCLSQCSKITASGLLTIKLKLVLLTGKNTAKKS